VPLQRRSNLRLGLSTFNYSHTFDKDGVSYKGTLGLRSVQATYDFFPFAGGFHLSPGALLYNGNQISANASVPGGSSFTLSGTTYVSSSANPLSGKGSLAFNKAAPMFLIGWGNLARRSERHFGVSFDLGFAYQGAGRTNLNFAGSVCDATGAFCRDVTTDPTFQSNVLAEQNKINRSVAPFRFFPVMSLGFGYRF
jgi:hypothetical protein